MRKLGNVEIYDKDDFSDENDYIEFVKGADSAHLNEVKVMGTKTNTNETVLRDGSLEEILEMKAYEETDYAKPITNEETIANTQIIEASVQVAFSKKSAVFRTPIT